MRKSERLMKGFFYTDKMCCYIIYPREPAKVTFHTVLVVLVIKASIFWTYTNMQCHVDNFVSVVGCFCGVFFYVPFSIKFLCFALVLLLFCCRCSCSYILFLFGKQNISLRFIFLQYYNMY